MNNENNTEYKYCLNCQTELHGKYCHACGQLATQQKPTVKEFLMEYLNIAFIWDLHFVKTIKKLLLKPGYLTSEYVSGKFVSYTHPIKLNMFLLFVFITMFLLFHSDENMGNAIQNFTQREEVQLELITEDKAYMESLNSSRTDTVQLYAPLNLSLHFPEIIANADKQVSVYDDQITVWNAALPHKLIEDGVLTLHSDGYYVFNADEGREIEGQNELETIWKQMITLTTKFFPIIILFTVPFLAFLIHIQTRNRNHSKFKHFIFSLHYTAFLELVIIFLYILNLTVLPPSWFMQTIIMAGSVIYLTFAIKYVYETKRWTGALLKSIMTNIGYFLILLSILIFLFFIALIITVTQL
ncbi:MAG: DUF3667 domain-containing protein [Bacteroidales bacterium]|nr:DUF3667 domain-containing protein [Bacteroidales bacterium]